MTQQTIKLDSDSRTIRISKNNYEKLVSQGKYKDTVDSILSKILEQNEKSGLGNPEIKNP